MQTWGRENCGWSSVLRREEMETRLGLKLELDDFGTSVGMATKRGSTIHKVKQFRCQNLPFPCDETITYGYL